MKTTVLVIVCLFCSVFFSCDNALSKIHKNPEQYLIQELRNKRILMLADFGFGHGQPLPYHSILALLNTWVSLVEQESDVDKHIVLVLESTGMLSSLFKQFIKTNDPNPFLDSTFLSEQFTLETLEFYSNLRRFSNKIDSLNARLPENTKIGFDILGPEGVPVYRPNESLDSLSIDIFNYYLKDRDLLTAHRVIDYLAIHKDTKAIFFYGGAHLIKTLDNKSFHGDGRVRNKNAKGYYLAHYLKEAFGDRQVLSVNQIRYDSADALSKKIAPSIVANLGKDNFYIEPNALFRKLLLFPRYDGYIVRMESFAHGHEVNRIFSRNIVKHFLFKMNNYLSDTTNTLLKRDYLWSITTILPYFSGKHFEYPTKPELWFKSNKPTIALAEWTNWLKMNDSTFSQRLESKSFEDGLKLMYLRSFGSMLIKDELLSIGFSEKMWKMSGFSENQWDSLIWPLAIDRIKCINAIGQYWIGDSAEQFLAHDILVRYTGKNFSNPDLYLKWFRNEKDSISY